LECKSFSHQNRNSPQNPWIPAATASSTPTFRRIVPSPDVDTPVDIVTALRQFEGTLPGPLGGDFSDDTGIAA